MHKGHGERGKSDETAVKEHRLEEKRRREHIGEQTEEKGRVSAVINGYKADIPVRREMWRKGNSRH